MAKEELNTDALFEEEPTQDELYEPTVDNSDSNINDTTDTTDTTPTNTDTTDTTDDGATDTTNTGSIWDTVDDDDYI